MTPNHRIETDRFTLQHLEPADLDPFYALYRDPEVRRYFPDGTRTHAQTRQELEFFARGYPRRPRLGLRATIERKSGGFLGCCGLLPREIDGKDAVEVAFVNKKQRWREGLATEAAHGVVRYAQFQLGRRRLVRLIMPGNVASASSATPARARTQTRSMAAES